MSSKPTRRFSGYEKGATGLFEVSGGNYSRGGTIEKSGAIGPRFLSAVGNRGTDCGLEMRERSAVVCGLDEHTRFIKKLSQNTLTVKVKFLLPGEKARLRGMFSTAVQMLSNRIFYRTASPHPRPQVGTRLPRGEGVLG